METPGVIELLKNHLLIANLVDDRRKKFSKRLITEVNRQTLAIWRVLEKIGVNREQLEAELTEEVRLMNRHFLTLKTKNSELIKASLLRYRQKYEENCRKRGVVLPSDYWKD